MYNNCCKLSFSPPREGIKEKMKSSISCFRWTAYIEGPAAVVQLGDDVKTRTVTARAPHIKEKCKNFISRIGKGGRKQYNSSDFSYDPLSYALNFEDETIRANELHSNIINFTSRLPATPDQTQAVKSSPPVSIRREVLAYC